MTASWVARSKVNEPVAYKRDTHQVSGTISGYAAQSQTPRIVAVAPVR